MKDLKTAEYLSAPAEYGTVVPAFRKTFRLEKPILRAVLTVTAIGLYEAELNGKRVGSFVLAPGWTNYKKRLQVQEYDVSAMLKENNVLTLTLGEGWACGRIGWSAGQGGFFPRPAVIALLTLTFEDGTVEAIPTDESWQCGKTPILFSGIYDGETYDARIVTDFSDAPVIADYPKDIFIPQEGEEVREKGAVTAKKVFTTPKGETVIDFGQEFTGYLTVTPHGKAGDVCRLIHFEVLDKDGNVYLENLRSAKQTVTYLCSGEEGETCHPHFSFQGFRYVMVESWPGEVKTEDFTGTVLCSDIRRTGTFLCSDPAVNRLYQNVIWGQLSNFVDVPTDCPQRDERLGWTGDAQVFCRTAALNFDVRKFFTKWLNDMTSEQLPDGGIPAVIPDALHGNGRCSSGWADSATIVPWQMYQIYGDKSFLARQFDTMKGWVDYIRAQSDRETIWNTGHHYADWLALDHPTDQKGATDHGLIATAYFSYSVKLLVAAGQVLGKDVSYYEELWYRIKRDFNETYRPNGKFVTPTQTAHALALHFGLVDDKKECAASLVRLIRENGNALNTGFLGTSVLMETLTENGYPDVAYDLLLRHEFPSWLFSVDMGATTIWEHWDGIRPDGGMWSAAMNSFNHYAYGAVASWMYSCAAGIRADENAPGFTHFYLNPIPDPRLSFVQATFETDSGTIASAWRTEGEEITFDFTVPEAKTATVILGTETFKVNPGTYRFVRKTSDILAAR